VNSHVFQTSSDVLRTAKCINAVVEVPFFTLDSNSKVPNLVTSGNLVLSFPCCLSSRYQHFHCLYSDLDPTLMWVNSAVSTGEEPGRIAMCLSRNGPMNVNICYI